MKAYLIRVLASRRSDAGYFLIELISVIVIIGILAALSIPTVMNSVSKARRSEAVTYIGTINTAQLQFFAEKQEFAPTITDLAPGIPQRADGKYGTDNYDYDSTVSGTGDQQEADSTATPTAQRSTLPAVAGNAYLQGTGDTVTPISKVCVSSTSSVPQLQGTKADCPTGSSKP